MNILGMNRAVELGRIEQELYRRITSLCDDAPVEEYLIQAEHLMDVLLEEFYLIYDGVTGTVVGYEADIIKRRLAELDELSEKIEGLRKQSVR